MTDPSLNVPFFGDTRSSQGCAQVQQAVRDYVKEQCASHPQRLQRSDGSSCGCGNQGPSSPDVVDLIVLMDSTGSLDLVAQDVVSSIDQGLDAAGQQCEATDVRIERFVVHDASATALNKFSNLGFAGTHRQYLQSIGASGPVFVDDAIGKLGEEGADAIADLATFFDWRPNSCRSILYISDTSLDGATTPPAAPADMPNLAAQQAAVDRAVLACVPKGVGVFAHMVSPEELQSEPLADVQDTYHDLCARTRQGGFAAVGVGPSAALYEDLLTEAICQSCAPPPCQVAECGPIEPCVSISWGESAADVIETHDDEKLCITVENCYSNVTFKDVTIGYVWLTDQSGTPPAIHPDGTPAARIYPLGPLCFGDIGPCIDGIPQRSTQELMFITRHLAPGAYKLHVGWICFRTEFEHDSNVVFDVDIVSS